MRKLLFLTVLGCLGSLAALPGQNPPAKPAVTLNLDPWIEQLGDTDFRKRDQALDYLQAQGPAALPALRKAINHPDLEVRRRILDLIPSIETSAILAPRRVTLQAKDKPLREIIDEIGRQTGQKIDFWANNPNQPYSFDFRNVTFWEAMERVCRGTGLTIQMTYGEDRLRLHQQNGYVPHVQHSGAFRFTANNIQQLRTIDLNLINRDGVQVRRNESLTLSFTVFVEPRLSILGMGEVKLDAAYDNEKNSLLPAGNHPEMMDGFPGGMGVRRWSSGRYGNRANAHMGSVNLNRVSEKATMIKTLRGSVPVNLLAEQKPVVVTDKVLDAKGKKIKVDSTSIHVVEATKMANGQYQVRLDITEENKDANDYSWMNTMYQRLRLEDDKGNVFQVYGTNWGNNSPNHVEMTFTYGPPPNVKTSGPTKLVFMSWTTMLHQLHFEFKDLPLP
jgi:hypothetical protein